MKLRMYAMLIVLSSSAVYAVRGPGASAMSVDTPAEISKVLNVHYRNVFNPKSNLLIAPLLNVKGWQNFMKRIEDSTHQYAPELDGYYMAFSKMNDSLINTIKVIFNGYIAPGLPTEYKTTGLRLVDTKYLKLSKSDIDAIRPMIRSLQTENYQTVGATRHDLARLRGKWRSSRLTSRHKADAAMALEQLDQLLMHTIFTQLNQNNFKALENAFKGTP